MKFLLITVLVVLSVERIFGSHFEAKSKLWKHLFDDYNKEFEPENTEIKFGLSFQCAKFHRKLHELHTVVWERYLWKDSRLTWEASDYDNVTTLRVSHDELWVPDFKLYNGYDERLHTKVLLKNDGTLIWVPPTVYKTQCERGANKTLHCHYKVGSWTYDHDTLALTEWNSGADFDYYQNDVCPLVPKLDEVKLLKKTYPCCQNLEYSALDVAVDYSHREECEHNVEDDEQDHHGHGQGHGQGQEHHHQEHQHVAE